MLHNMRVEDECDIIHKDMNFNYDTEFTTPTIELSRNCTNEIMEFI